MALGTFYRRVWRWHFWMGLICAPLLIVTALTGAIWVFKDEITSANRSHLAYVTPTGDRKPLDECLAAVQERYPEERPTWATLYAAPDRADVIQVVRKVGEKSVTRLVFVNPYSAEIRGDEPIPASDSFFNVVIDLHTSLYADRVGRSLIELVTSWSVVLVVSGLYLWWPRRFTDFLGVWLPRVGGPFYTLLRDLHSIPGALLAAVAVALAVTGLFFTQVWGGVYAGAFGKYPEELTVVPKQSEVSKSTVPIETVVREARNRWPDSTLRLELSAKPTAPHSATSNHPAGDRIYGFVAVDRATGDVVADRRAADIPLPNRIKLWVYPIHVGSVYGTPTKVLAVLGALMLVFASVSGVAMWWVRKPEGRSGFPAAVEARVPVPAVWAILILAVLLPTVGVSLFLVLAGEWFVFGSRSSAFE